MGSGFSIPMACQSRQASGRQASVRHSGDSTFFHSVTSLLDAVHTDRMCVVHIGQQHNRYDGHQENAGTQKNLMDTKCLQ